MTWFWIWVAVSIVLIVACWWRGRTVRLVVGSHHMRVGDGPLRMASTGPLPDGIRGDVDYYVVAVGSDHVDLERR